MEQPGCDKKPTRTGIHRFFYNGRVFVMAISDFDYSAFMYIAIVVDPMPVALMYKTLLKRTVTPNPCIASINADHTATALVISKA
jgi:hypothetical protein